MPTDRTKGSTAQSGTAQALTGLRVLDLSRILAGPTATQLLSDLGAEVLKIERPGAGDDTRGWGPPFLGDGGPSAYFLSANRGKHSVAVNIADPRGQALVQGLAACEGANIPAGPVNDLAQVFASPQVAARGMRVDTTLATGQAVSLIGNPLKMSHTPVTYDQPPPALGADTGAVLARDLGLSGAELAALAAEGVIGGVLDP